MQPIPEFLPPPELIRATVPPPNPIAAAEAAAPPVEDPKETAYVDYGIRTPDGNVHYGTFNGKAAIDTPQARAVFLAALRVTARETGFPEEEFLSRYSWVGRHVHLTALGDVPITHESVFPPALGPQ